MQFNMRYSAVATGVHNERQQQQHKQQQHIASCKHCEQVLNGQLLFTMCTYYSVERSIVSSTIAICQIVWWWNAQKFDISSVFYVYNFDLFSLVCLCAFWLHQLHLWFDCAVFMAIQIHWLCIDLSYIQAEIKIKMHSTLKPIDKLRLMFASVAVAANTYARSHPMNQAAVIVCVQLCMCCWAEGQLLSNYIGERDVYTNE